MSEAGLKGRVVTPKAGSVLRRERRTICPLCMQTTPITTTKCWLVWYHGRCWRSLWVGPLACGAALWGLALCGGPLRVQADPPTRATASLQVPVFFIATILDVIRHLHESLTRGTSRGGDIMHESLQPAFYLDRQVTLLVRHSSGILTWIR